MTGTEIAVPLILMTAGSVIAGKFKTREKFDSWHKKDHLTGNGLIVVGCIVFLLWVQYHVSHR